MTNALIAIGFTIMIAICWIGRSIEATDSDRL